MDKDRTEGDQRHTTTDSWHQGLARRGGALGVGTCDIKWSLGHILAWLVTLFGWENPSRGPIHKEYPVYYSQGFWRKLILEEKIIISIIPHFEDSKFSNSKFQILYCGRNDQSLSTDFDECLPTDGQWTI